MRGFFAAKHVAIFGVSTRPGNLGARIVQNLLKFAYQGRITLIGRGGGAIAGHAIVPRLDPERHRDVDLAVILTPAATIPEIFRQCAAQGIRRLVVESGGFAELGAAGRRLSAELKQIAKDHDLRFIGPNGIGVVDTAGGLAVPFSTMPQPAPGPVSVITQSGGVGLLYACHFLDEGIGLSKFVSMGNKLDVDENDLLAYLIEDERTRLVLMYLESIPRGRALFALMRNCPKPIIVHKSNIGETSRAIAGSHTAALVNDDAVVDAAFKQAGVVRTADLKVTINRIKTFLMPPMRGDRVVVVSRSGGHAIIAADECGKVGMTFPALPDTFLDRVGEKVRAGVIRLGNPLDVGDLFDLDAYLTIMDEVMALPQADAVLFSFLMISQRDQRFCERLVDRAQALAKQYDKPLALVIYTWPEILIRLRSYSEYPIFETAEGGVRALATGRDWARFKAATPRRAPQAQPKPAAAELLAKVAPGGYLPQDEAFGLLSLYGIAHPPIELVRTSAQAVKAFARLGGGPAVMKVESPDVVHKSDLGGVLLNLRNAREVRRAFLQLRDALAARRPAARFSGALLMPQADRGVELIAGIKVDPSFGPVIMLGWGGVAAEAMEKVSLRLAPITRREALQMIAELPGQKLLGAFRGRAGIDRRRLAETLVKLGRLAGTPGLSEADVNPLVAYPDGVLALDVRVRVRP